MINSNGQYLVSKVGPDENSEEAPLKQPHARNPGSGLDSNKAEQLADVASYATGEMTQVIVRLQEILDGFKETVEAGDYVGDREIGQSLGGILSAVEEVRAQMENIAAYAIAMSSAALAQMAEELRLDMRRILTNKHR